MKKIITKICCIILIVACTLTTVACKNATKGDPEAIYIGIQVQGYGKDWLYTLADAYEKKTGVKCYIQEFSLDGQALSDFKRGNRNNNTDIYFLIEDNILKQVPTTNYFCKLDDVYNSKPEGYDDEYSTIKDLVNDYAYNTSLFNDTPYVFSWALAMEGWMYHEDMLNNYGLTIPRTTDELLATCNSFMQNSKKPDNAWAFGWYEGYIQDRVFEWICQYIGYDAYVAFSKGQDINGNYTADIYASQGRLEAFKVAEKLMEYNKYCNPVDLSSQDSFTKHQMDFFAGKSLFMPNGDWIEREMEKTLETLSEGERDYKFMKAPIISSITKTFSKPSDWTDALLCQAIDFVDGVDGSARPSCATDSDIEKIAEARDIMHCQSERQIGCVPNYCDNIDGAKEFIKWMYSKEAQMILYKTMKGNVFPLKYNFAKEPNAETSIFQQSKYELLDNPNLKFVGYDYSSQLRTTTGLGYLPLRFIIQLASRPEASDYKTASEVYNEDYNLTKKDWSELLERAGI